MFTSDPAGPDRVLVLSGRVCGSSGRRMAGRLCGQEANHDTGSFSGGDQWPHPRLCRDTLVREMMGYRKLQLINNLEILIRTKLHVFSKPMMWLT